MTTTSRDDPGWWQGAVGYEIYIRSFNDSDGDGVGDLDGITERLDYLAWLGIEVVWITPFYPSPGADHGYDVADYCAVDARLGTLDQLDVLTATAHRLGLRVMIDLVPNHSSDRHPWFQKALSSTDSEHRDYYHWQRPGRDGALPNNWVSHFGGPAWTLDPASGEYYLHLFLSEQPDLNWSLPRVRDEFDRILEFWFARGIDGFRIDVAHALMKDADLRDNPSPDDGPIPADPLEAFWKWDHRHDLDQPEVTEIHRRWRDIAARHDAVLVGEVYLDDPRKITRYVAGGGLHGAFTFPLMRAPWDAEALRRALMDHSAALTSGAAWVLGSHDDGRPATRFGRGERGRRRALALTSLIAVLPGALFLYQGEELGLDDPELSPGQVEDPVARAAGSSGRDAARTPMPWSPGPGGGFTAPDTEPWLPLGGRAPAETVEQQRGDPNSHLACVRRLLAARREIRRAPQEIGWMDTGHKGVIGIRRGGYLALLNVGDVETASRLPEGEWSVMYSSGDEARLSPDALAHVPPETTVLLREA